VYVLKTKVNHPWRAGNETEVLGTRWVVKPPIVIIPAGVMTNLNDNPVMVNVPVISFRNTVISDFDGGLGFGGKDFFTHFPLTFEYPGLHSTGFGGKDFFTHFPLNFEYPGLQTTGFGGTDFFTHFPFTFEYPGLQTTGFDGFGPLTGNHDASCLKRTVFWNFLIYTRNEEWAM
jgi:hypothetical protein